MSVYNLDYLFKPKRLALVYSKALSSLGETLFRNIILTKFRGIVYLISEEEEVLMGIQSYPDLYSVPREVNAVLLATEPEKWLTYLEQCERKGVRAVALYYPDFKTKIAGANKILQQIKVFSYQKKIRLLGPNTLGYIVPRLDLNASLYEGKLLSGHIGFISDSATLASGILDWAVDKKVGFSLFVSLGEKVDIDIEDMIDYLGYDPSTRAIVIYLERLDSGRKFMRSARGFARSKPIIVLKGGIPREDAQSTIEILNRLIIEDKVYSTAFKRAGLIEVKEVADLFHMAEVLEKQPRPKGPSLAIVTNSGGFSHLALKTLSTFKGRRSEFTPETLSKLREILKIPEGSITNPVDLHSTAEPTKYREVIEVLCKAEEVDGILVIFSPQFYPSSMDVALAISSAYRNAKANKPLLIALVGADKIRSAEQYLNEQGFPVYHTPEEAVKSFIYMYQYDKNIQLLFETPSNILSEFSPDKKTVRDIITKAYTENRDFLTENDALNILKAYQISVSEKVDTFSTLSLMIGVKRDRVFGSVILFGLGDNIAKLGLDYAIGLPPLNQILARRIIEETVVHELLKETNFPLQILEELLVKISYLIIDFPELEEFLINPIVLTDKTYYCLRAYFKLSEPIPSETERVEGIYCPSHLCICPYPTYLISQETLKNGIKVEVRPIKPEDEPLLVDLFKNLSERSTLLRFYQLRKPIDKKDLIRFCHIDYDQEMTLVALIEDPEGTKKIIGAGHLMKTYEDVAELSIEVLDYFQGLGLGTLLCEKLLNFARINNYKKVWMEIKRENIPMIRLAEKLRFQVVSEEEGVLFVEKNL